MNKIIKLLFCVFTFYVNAQNIERLTLKDAISYALKNKAEALKADLNLENSQYLIEEAKSRALPQISANGNLTYNPVLQTTFINGSVFGSNGYIKANFGQAWISGAGVSLAQVLFDESVFTGLKAARSTREFYQINKTLTEEQIIERVANNYYQIYVLKQNLAIANSNYQNTDKTRNIIKGQYDNGLAKKIDLDRISVKLSNIETQKQQVINAIALQENALKFFMGMPIETQIKIPETEFDQEILFPEGEINTLNRTEYLLLKKKEDLLTYQKKAMKSGYYPSLFLVANYNYIGQGPTFPWFGKQENNVFWSDYSSVSLGLKVPIFTGLGNKARVSQADISLRSVQEDLKDTKLGLELQYENAKTQINNSIITLKLQKENQQLAKEVLENTRNNYMQGLAPLTDLLDAENAHVESQNNYTTAVLNYKLAEIQLIKSRGELKTLLK